MNRNFCLSVIIAMAGAFAWAAQAEPIFSRFEPKRPLVAFDWNPNRLTAAGLVYGRDPKGNWHAYRFQHETNGTTTGIGVGYMLKDTPLSSWLGDNHQLWNGLHYDPRSVKVDVAVETKSWSYSPKMTSPIRFSDPDTPLGSSDITDRSYRILFTIPF